MLKKGEQNEITSLVTLNINFKTQPFQSTERNLKIMYFSKQPVYICSQLLDRPKCTFSSKSLFLSICCTLVCLGVTVKQYQFMWNWEVKKRRPPISILLNHYNWTLSLSLLSSAQNLLKNTLCFLLPEHKCQTSERLLYFGDFRAEAAVSWTLGWKHIDSF